MAVELGFDVHTTRFLDRDVARALDPVKRRFFLRAGGAIRTTARRSLRKARQKKTSELTDEQRLRYEKWKAMYEAGKSGQKPRRPEIISEPGQPPLLHQKPSSLLKNRLLFALNEDSNGVVIGPEQTSRAGKLQALEGSRPFMRPAYEAIEPRLNSFLAAAAR